MACHFCLGYCGGLGVVQRNLLSLRFAYGDDAIRTHDYRHTQAYETAKILSGEASDLRMFFCVEVGQKFIGKMITTGLVAEYADVVDLDCFNQPVACTADGLRQLTRGTEQMLDVIEAVDFEMTVRSKVLGSFDGVVKEHYKEQYRRPPAEKVKKQLIEYRRYVTKVREFLNGRGRRRPDHAAYDRLGYVFTDLLHAVELPYDGYFVIFNYMAQIADGYTVSPWTTKLPIFPE
jgi:hypothetical protein